MVAQFIDKVTFSALCRDELSVSKNCEVIGYIRLRLSRHGHELRDSGRTLRETTQDCQAKRIAQGAGELRGLLTVDDP